MNINTEKRDGSKVKVFMIFRYLILSFFLILLFPSNVLNAQTMQNLASGSNLQVCKQIPDVVLTQSNEFNSASTSIPAELMSWAMTCCPTVNASSSPYTPSELNQIKNICDKITASGNPNQIRTIAPQEGNQGSSRAGINATATIIKNDAIGAIGNTVGGATTSGGNSSSNDIFLGEQLQSPSIDTSALNQCDNPENNYSYLKKNFTECCTGEVEPATKKICDAYDSQTSSSENNCSDPSHINASMDNFRSCCSGGESNPNYDICSAVFCNKISADGLSANSDHYRLCCAEGNDDPRIQKKCDAVNPGGNEQNQCSDITYLSDRANYKTCCESSNEFRDENACGEVLCTQQSADNLRKNERLKIYCCTKKESTYQDKQNFQDVQSICLDADSTNSCQNIGLQNLKKDPSLFKQCCTGDVDRATKKICDLVNTEEVNYCEDTSHTDEVDNAETYFSKCCRDNSNRSNKDVVKRCSAAQCLEPSFIKKSFSNSGNIGVYNKLCCDERNQTDEPRKSKVQIGLCQKASQIPVDNQEEDAKAPEENNSGPTASTPQPDTSTTFEVESSFNNNNDFDIRMCLNPNLIRKFEKDESTRNLMSFHKTCCANRMAFKKFKKMPGRVGRNLERQCVKVKKMISEKNETFQKEVLESKCSNDNNFNAEDPSEYMEKCCSRKAKSVLGSDVGQFCQKGKEIIEREGATAKCEKGGIDFVMKNFSDCCDNSSKLKICREAISIQKCLVPKYNYANFRNCCKGANYEPLIELCQKTKHRLSREKEQQSQQSADRCLDSKFAYKNYGNCCSRGNHKVSPERGKICNKVGAELRQEQQSQSSTQNCDEIDYILLSMDNFTSCCRNPPENRVGICKEAKAVIGRKRR